MSSYNRQPVFPVLMVAAGVVLILGSIFWIVNAAPSESTAAPQIIRTLDPAQGDVPALSTSAPRIPYPNIQRVNVDDAKTAFDSQKAVFIDARGQLYFDTGHIPGAIPLSDQDIPAKIGSLDPNAWIITYCT